MFEDRESTSRRPMNKYWSATVSIIVINVFVFLIQLYFGGTEENPNSKFEQLFALSLDGLRAGHLWQFLTFQFMHAGWLHLFVNCWVLYMFGRITESVAGKKHMLQLYFLSGVAGGVLQMIWTFVLPPEFNGPVVGASAGVSGLVAAFAVLFPTQRILLYFVIPLKARLALLLLAAFTVYGMVAPFFKTSFMGNIAHAGHLGGMIAGYIYARWLVRRYGMPRVIEQPNPSLKITPVSD
jgi:membrane associated rhomboid family serine protease